MQTHDAITVASMVAATFFCAVCATSAEQPVGHASPITFFVSTAGNDAWSGRRPVPGGRDGPFATIVRARNAVRALRRAHMQRPLRVVLRGGTYYLDRPLEFGPEDSGTKESPIVYAATVGERDVLSG